MMMIQTINLDDSVRYKITGADFTLEFSAPKASTRKELGGILAELSMSLLAEEIEHPELF